MVIHSRAPVSDSVDFVQVGFVSGRGGDRDACFNMLVVLRTGSVVVLANGIPVNVVP